MYACQMNRCKQIHIHTKRIITQQCTYTPRCTSLTSFSTQSYRLSHKRTSSDHIQTALYLHFPPPIHQSHFLYIHTTPKHHLYNIPLTPCTFMSEILYHLYNIPLTPCTFMSEILYLPSLQPSFHAPTSRTTAPAGHNDY